MDWIDKLTELRRLKETGAIDAAEFDARRADIFAERDTVSPARPSSPSTDADPIDRLDAPESAAPVDVHSGLDPRPQIDEPLAARQPNAEDSTVPLGSPPRMEPVSTDSVEPPLEIHSPALPPSRPPMQDAEIRTVASTSTIQPTGGAPARVPLALLAIGGAALLAVGLAFGVLLSKGPLHRSVEAAPPATPPIAQPAASSPAVQPPIAAPSFAAAPPAQPTPAILSGRVTTSVAYDELQNPSFTAILVARYSGVGPQDQIAASLWKGSVEIGACASGPLTLLPTGTYRCEWSQLAPGAYEFRVGFPGQRASIFQFANVPRRALAPQPPSPTDQSGLPPSPDVITNPQWIRLPTGEDISRYYPPGAMLRGIEGVTRISCSVSVTGQLVGCVVQSETPPGYGFGEAAIRFASAMRMRPMTRNGQPVDGGTVTVPIRWRLQ